MRLPKFLLCTNKQELTSQVIISTVKPYHTAIVWTFIRPDEYAEALANDQWLGYTVVDNYMIILSFNGSLDGTVTIGNLPRFKDEMAATLEEMKQFFFKERIEQKPGFYQKFLRP